MHNAKQLAYNLIKFLIIPSKFYLYLFLGSFGITDNYDSYLFFLA